MHRYPHPLRIFSCLAGGLLAWTAVHGTVAISVGQQAVDPKCGYADIQSALDDAYTVANGNPSEPVEVWLTRSIDYADVSASLHVPADATITLRGGFPNCDGSTYDGVHTPINGYGSGSASIGPVFSITVDSGGYAYVKDLDIGSGNNVGHDGGGIYLNATQGGLGGISGGLTFEASKITASQAARGGGIFAAGPSPKVLLVNAEIANNTATSGGGIYFYASNGAITVRDTLVHDNMAGGSGGGIFVDAGGSIPFNIDGNYTAISNNTANDGDGGGIFLSGPVTLQFIGSCCTQLLHDNHAHSGASGYGRGGGVAVTGAASMNASSGKIYKNDAVHGGGVAIIADADTTLTAAVRVYTTIPDGPPRVLQNSASVSGGGFYLDTTSAGVRARLCLADYIVGNNIAPAGGAIYSDASVGLGGFVSLNENYDDPNFCGSELPALGAQHCATGIKCNEISGNQASGGAIIAGNHLTLDANRLAMHLNFDTPIKLSSSKATLFNCLLAQNYGPAVLDVPDLTLSGCTLVQNSADTGMIFASSATIYRSILDNYKTTPMLSASSAVLRDVLSTDTSAMTNGTRITKGKAHFIDEAGGNYHLFPQSIGVDYAPAGGPVDGAAELEGGSRLVDLVPIPDLYGPRDLGAYERQFAFDCDLNDDAIFCSGFQVVR